MSAVLVPFRAQHGVRSGFVPLATAAGFKPVGRTDWIAELTRQTARGSYTRGFKQDGGKRAIRQTAGTAGNFDGKSCSLVGKWKQKFEIYLKVTGAAKKPDEMKVGLLLNHIGEPCLEIYSNVIFLLERDDPAGGEDKLPAENPNNYATVMAKFDEYFQKRDPQLMLREKFWVHLKREPTQTLDSWVVTVKERAAECKFPADFYEQAVRDKLTSSCNENNYKLKLYDEVWRRSNPFNKKAVKILSLKEATKRELQESKTAEIKSVTPLGNRPVLITDQDTEHRNQRDSKRKPFQTNGRNCGYCNRRHAPGRRKCPAADTRCSKCNKIGHFPIICKSVPAKTVNQVLETEDAFSPTFVGGVTAPTCSNTSMAEPVANPQTGKSDSGWHVKLKIQDQDMLTWCIDTGAQVCVMPEAIYKSSYGMLSKSDTELVGAGNVPLVTLGCAVMNLTLAETVIKEQVYIVRGASKLLLGVPTLRSLGLIHEIPGTYSVKGVNQMPYNHPLRSRTKEDIVKQHPMWHSCVAFYCFRSLYKSRYPYGSSDLHFLLSHVFIRIF